MPSRKRNKGKERKAKAKDKSCGVGWRDLPLDKCCHGAKRNLPTGHVCYFYKDYFVEQFSRNRDALQAMKLANEKYPEAWSKETNRASLRSYFLYAGTEVLLQTDSEEDRYACARCLAGAVMLMENVDGIDLDTDTLRIGSTPKELLANRDLVQGCVRSLMKFYVSRIPCNCLAAMYANLKQSTQKTSECDCCEQRMPRRKMLYCTGCGEAQFCSRECHVQYWPIHKEKCIHWRKEKVLGDCSASKDYTQRLCK